MDEYAAERVTLREILQVLRRRRAVVVLTFLLVPLLALGFSLLQQKQYTASASLLFRDPGLNANLLDPRALAPSTDPNRQAGTNVELVSLDVVADRTAERLGGLSGDDVSDMVEIKAEGQSDVVSIEATNPNPRFAARLADTFAGEYVVFRRDADRAKVTEAQRLLESQIASLPPSERGGPRGRSLEDRAQELQVLAALQTGNAELVQRADVPTEPSSPQPVRNTAIGAVLGLLLGVGLAFLLEQLDRRLKRPEEVEAIFGRPILGAVPESKALAAAAGTDALPGREQEAFRMLRANLRYFDLEGDVRSLVVTSAAPGEGKSTVAWNLAATAAASGGRVLLVEADLRHPSLARRHGLSASLRGLSNVLAGDATTEGAVYQVALGMRQSPDPYPRPESRRRVANRNSGPEISLDVLVAGPLPPNPSDLIESKQMADLIESAEQSYDMVVIDTPPTSLVSDAIPLVKQVGGVIVVCRLGQTTRDLSSHLHRQLERLKASTLGVVLNAIGGGDSYYGAYGYGDGGHYYDAAGAPRQAPDEQFSAPVDGADGGAPAGGGEPADGGEAAAEGSADGEESAEGAEPADGGRRRRWRRKQRAGQG